MALKRVVYKIFLSSNTLILLNLRGGLQKDNYEVDDTHLVIYMYGWGDGVREGAT